MENIQDAIKAVIEWCDRKGHNDHETLELISIIVGATPVGQKEEEI